MRLEATLDWKTYWIHPFHSCAQPRILKFEFIRKGFVDFLTSFPLIEDFLDNTLHNYTLTMSRPIYSWPASWNERNVRAMSRRRFGFRSRRRLSVLIIRTLPFARHRKTSVRYYVCLVYSLYFSHSEPASNCRSHIQDVFKKIFLLKTMECDTAAQKVSTN